MKRLSFKINPISGTACWSKNPKLGMVISFKQEGTGESYSLYTLRHWTTVQGEQTVFMGLPMHFIIT
ncbi:MAG: hypothetical protein ACFFAQ_14065 [Promethearchaeota archaeon]